MPRMASFAAEGWGRESETYKVCAGAGATCRCPHSRASANPRVAARPSQPLVRSTELAVLCEDERGRPSFVGHFFLELISVKFWLSGQCAASTASGLHVVSTLIPTPTSENGDCRAHQGT